MGCSPWWNGSFLHARGFGGWFLGGGFWGLLLLAGIIILILLLVRRRPSPRFSETCPRCREAVSPAYLRCPCCGEILQTHCPECSRVIKAGWTFCPYCATELRTAERGSV